MSEGDKMRTFNIEIKVKSSNAEFSSSRNFSISEEIDNFIQANGELVFDLLSNKMNEISNLIEKFFTGLDLDIN